MNSVDYVVTWRRYPKIIVSPSSVVINQGDMARLSAFVVSSDMGTPNGLIADSLHPDEILARYTLEWSTTEDSFALSEDSGAITSFSTSVAIDSTARDFSIGASYTIRCTVKITKGTECVVKSKTLHR